MTIKKHFTVYILLAIFSLYLFTRLTELTILPIFNDEATYIHWAKLINDDSSNLLISIQADNKKPLHFWLISIALNLFQDPLWAGRSISVLSGLFSLIGIYLAGCRLHSTTAGILSAFLYVISPYHLFFDRIAHDASLLNCFFIWTIWLTLFLLYQTEKKIHPLNYWLLSVITGFGLLTASTSFLFIFLPILFFFKKRDLQWKLILLSYLSGVVIGLLPYVIIFLTSNNFEVKNIFVPRGHSLGQSNIFELMQGIPGKLYHSLDEFLGYLTDYLTLPIFLLAALFPIVNFRSFNNKHLILLANFLIPAFILLGAAGEGFSRYYLFCSTPLLFWASLTLIWIWELLNKLFFQKQLASVFAAILSLLFLPAVVFDYKLMAEPERAPLIESDRHQYVINEFSGYGVPEAIAYFRDIARNKKITILTSSAWGNPADAVYVYLDNNPNIKIISAYWISSLPLLPPQLRLITPLQPYTQRVSEKIRISDLTEVYFIQRASTGYSRNLFIRINPNFQLVKIFKKPEGKSFVEIYKLDKD